MCLNTQINYEALEENFELSPFAGLKHIENLPSPRDRESVARYFNRLHKMQIFNFQIYYI